MKRLIPVLALAGAFLLAPAALASAATIVANVSLSTQTMTVSHRGKHLYTWKVSTAAGHKVTPTGSWSAKFLSKNHRSSRYNNAPMPFAIFYNGNFAVHGTNQISKLGRPASKGCVRLHPSHAATLFSMVQKEGLKNTRINVRR
jgi:lipoprotein-anchoring transpeptidase ErfK/SrfK